MEREISAFETREGGDTKSSMGDEDDVDYGRKRAGGQEEAGRGNANCFWPGQAVVVSLHFCLRTGDESRTCHAVHAF